MNCSWRPANGDWRDLHSAPASNLGFQEKCVYEIRKPSPDCHLFMDDERLPDHPTETTCWRWEPGFYAGEVTAELVAPSGEVTSFLLDVAPNPGKLGREMFAEMVAEIWSEDPQLVLGAEPATTPNGVEGFAENAWAQFARVRRYLPDFLRAVAAIRAKPRQTLRVRRDSVPLHHARRVDRQTAVSLLKTPACLLFTERSDSAVAVAAASRLNVPFMEESADSAANRAIADLLRKLHYRVQSLLEELAKATAAESESETRTSLLARWPRRRDFLEGMAVALEVTLRQPPFCTLSRAEVTSAGLTAIAADPIYARAWGLGWRALRHGLDSDSDIERLWISPSWEIYERWCFVRFGRLLASAMPSAGWRREGWRWSSAFGELTLQSVFRAGREASPGQWSISKERRPDLVLTAGTRFMVFDAKYRVARANIRDAMESAHLYQDSLRLGDARPEASLLFVPHAEQAAWMSEPAFHQEHRVGIHPLSPASPAALPEIVRTFLKNGEELASPS